MKVEIWSDVVCPWCYIGKRRFEAALEEFDHRDDVEVVWRAFELDPSAPIRREAAYATHLASKYGVSLPESQAMIDRMTETAAAEGLTFRFDIARPGNTFDAHRVVAFAAERGRQDVVVERLFQATFSEGQPIGDPDALERLAGDAGLDADEVRAMLESDICRDEVHADERQAVAFGITAVPFFVVDRAYGVSGAQPADVLRDVLHQAWAATHEPALRMTGTRGPACDDAGCDG